MGLISRLLLPRSVRRAMHPVRTVRWALTPRPVKRLKRAAHPLDALVWSATHSRRRRRR